MKLSNATRPIANKGKEFDIKSCEEYMEIRNTIVRCFMTLPIEYRIPYTMNLIKTLVNTLQDSIEAYEGGVANYKLKNIINFINDMEKEILREEVRFNK